MFAPDSAVTSKSLLPPGQAGWRAVSKKMTLVARQLLVPLGQAQRKPIRQARTTEEISAGLAPAGSQLTSYHAAKRSGWLSARLVRVEATTFQLADLPSVRPVMLK